MSNKPYHHQPEGFSRWATDHLQILGLSGYRIPRDPPVSHHSWDWRPMATPKLWWFRIAFRIWTGHRLWHILQLGSSQDHGVNRETVPRMFCVNRIFPPGFALEQIKCTNDLLSEITLWVWGFHPKLWCDPPVWVLGHWDLHEGRLVLHRWGVGVQRLHPQRAAGAKCMSRMTSSRVVCFHTTSKQAWSPNIHMYICTYGHV